MANASRDQNNVPTLLGASSSDGVTPVVVYADPATHRLLVQTASMSGSGAPATTPSSIGQMYTDTSGKKIYFATGTSSSSDWTIVN